MLAATLMQVDMQPKDDMSDTCTRVQEYMHSKKAMSDADAISLHSCTIP